MTLTANMIPDIMYTPFEILNLIVTVEVPHIEIWEQEQIGKFAAVIQNKLKSSDKERTEQNKSSCIFIKFNIMDYPQDIFYLDEETHEVLKATTKLGFTSESIFGIYDLAERKMKVEYTNQEKCSRIVEENALRNEDFCDWAKGVEPTKD